MAGVLNSSYLGAVLACALLVGPASADPDAAPPPAAAADPAPDAKAADLGDACDRASRLPREVAVVTSDRGLLEGVTEQRGDALAAVVKACTAAAAAEPDEPRFAFRLGLAQRDLGKLAEAVAAFERARTLGYPGGYDAIADAHLFGSLAAALPKDIATGLAVAEEGIAKTGNPEIKRTLALFLDRANPPHRDRARARLLLEEAIAAGHVVAKADLAKLLAEDDQRGDLRDVRIEPLLDEGSAAGSRHAEYIRGALLDNGVGFPRDLEGARRAYLKAAEAGEALAMRSVGIMMGLGEGGPKDIPGKRRWLSRAGALGDRNAKLTLGNSYVDEEPTNVTVGLYLLEDLAGNGSVEAAHGLGVRFQDSYGVQRDYARSKKWFLKASEAGDGRGYAQIGKMYDYGEGVPVDHAEARRWYDKAVALRVAEAHTSIGMQYDHAMGVPRDLGEALKWYRKGADLGAAASMNNLGFAYENARGIGRNLKEALRWYEEAVAKDDRTAKLNLGNMYLEGKGVAKDPVRGLKLLQAAADDGLPQALNDVALMEHRRPGGSDARAVKMLREAAVGGAAVAYHNLGMALMEGWDGVPDHVEANYWFRQSVEHASDLDPLAFSESQFQLGYNLVRGRGIDSDPATGRALITAAAKAGNPTARRYLAGSGNAVGKQRRRRN